MRAYSYADPEGLVRINNNDEPQLNIAPGPHFVTVVDELGHGSHGASRSSPRRTGSPVNGPEYNSPVGVLPFDDGFRQRVSDHLERFDRRPLAPNDLTRASVAIILVGDDNGEASFILTRRPLNLRRHAGQWALPGGRCDDGESTIDAARREADEEVGVKPRARELRRLSR